MAITRCPAGTAFCLNGSNRVGTGDVRFRSGFSNCLFLCLRSPGGCADLKLPMDQVKEFLDDTVDDAKDLDVLHLDLDEFLDEVLG